MLTHSDVLLISTNMANSRFGYVREFEEHDRLIPSTFSVVRIDGHSFHRCDSNLALQFALKCN